MTNIMNKKQQHYFKDLEGSRLFFAYHPPADNTANGIGILICDAILEEKQDSRRAMVNFANLASEAGFGVLRFDYRGQGESDGYLSDFSPIDTVNDIKFGYQELLGKPDITKAGILGLRFGCNLSVEAVANEKIDPEFMVHWAPELNSTNYAELILRSNLANQMIVHHKVVEDRKTLVKRMEAGEVINVDGYGLTLERYRYISSDNFANALKKYTGKTIIMDIDRNPDKKNEKWELFLATITDRTDHLKAVRLKSEIFWKLTPIYAVRPKEPFEKTMEFLVKNV